MLERGEMNLEARVGMVLVALTCGATCTPGPEPWSDSTDELFGGDIEVAPPAPPVLTPCPDEWSEVISPSCDVATCEPWPEGGPVDMSPCHGHDSEFPSGWDEILDDGQVICDPWGSFGYRESSGVWVQFPGESERSRIGTVCPEDGWPQDSTSIPNVIFVSPDASDTGDGLTQETAFDSLSRAVAEVESGDDRIEWTIALAVGTYREPVAITRRGITLVGACAERTRITSATSVVSEALIVVDAGSLSVRNLTIGGDGKGIFVQGGNVELEGVIIDGAFGYGIELLDGADLQASNIIVRETQSHARNTPGVGLLIYDESNARIHRALFERNRLAGISAIGLLTSLTLHDSVVRETNEGAFGDLRGVGLKVEHGAYVEVGRTVFERNLTAGLTASGLDTLLDLDQVFVRDIPDDLTTGRRSHGLEITNLATAQVVRSVFDRNRTSAISVSRATLYLGNVVVRDTTGDERNAYGGVGLDIESGSDVVVDSSVFERNRFAGVSVNDNITTLDMTDVVIRHTDGNLRDGANGSGLMVSMGPSVKVSRVLVEGNRSYGVYAAGQSSLKLTDAVIRGTRRRESDGREGIGLGAHSLAHVTLERVAIERNGLAGIFASGGGTRVGGSNWVVRDSWSLEDDNARGFGLLAVEGVNVSATLALFERYRWAGVAAYDDNTDVSFEHVTIRDSVLEAWWQSDGGHGVGVYNGAVVDLDWFLTSFNRACGVHLGVTYEVGHLSGTVSLTESEISYNTIAACVNTPPADFEIENLRDGIRYRGNGSDRVLRDADFSVPYHTELLSSEP